ncbi:lysozyme inhibitor LprI family protein [Comamonas kerstersii]|nr:lysozyme inhibitor LprI family protein [Comamonas kerstersii]
MTSLFLGLAVLAPAAAWAQAGAACVPDSAAAEHVNACAVQRFQAIDSAHHILYGDVMRALSANERPLLRKEQSAWNRQRHATCKARHAADEAAVNWPQRLHDCLSELTQERRQDLMHWLHHGAPAQR